MKVHPTIPPRPIPPRPARRAKLLSVKLTIRYQRAVLVADSGDAISVDEAVVYVRRTEFRRAS